MHHNMQHIHIAEVLLGVSYLVLFLPHSTVINIVYLGILDTPLEEKCKIYTYRVHNLQDIHKPGNCHMRDIPDRVVQEEIYFYYTVHYLI